MRIDQRESATMRAISFETNVNKHAEGSVLIAVGDTRVLCTATVEEKVPPFLRGKRHGWINAEYAMLPRATAQRTARESPCRLFSRYHGFCLKGFGEGCFSSM